MCYYFIIICLDLRIGNKTKDSRIITIQRGQRKGLLERGKKKKRGNNWNPTLKIVRSRRFGLPKAFIPKETRGDNERKNILFVYPDNKTRN